MRQFTRWTLTIRIWVPLLTTLLVCAAIPQLSPAHPAASASSLAYLTATIPEEGAWPFLKCRVDWKPGAHAADSSFAWIATDSSGNKVDGAVSTEFPHHSGTYARVRAAGSSQDFFLENDQVNSETWIEYSGWIGVPTYGGTTWRIAVAGWGDSTTKCSIQLGDGTIISSVAGDPANARAVRAADFQQDLAIETAEANVIVGGKYSFTSQGFMLAALRANGPARCTDPDGHVYVSGTRDHCTVQEPSLGEWQFEIDAGQRSSGAILYAITIPS